MSSSVERVQVAIAGGGPAGLCAAIALARSGISARVLERQSAPVDKACGEGLMPAGVDVLERLGVLTRLSESCELEGIRYVQEDGTSVEAPMPRRPGRGIRRVVLARALNDVARELGVRVVEGCRVEDFERTAECVRLTTSRGELEAQLLVVADGLQSALRARAGLHEPLHRSDPHRYGMRRHFELSPWTRHVEVHLAEGAEAYVTPVGARQVGVAMLWTREGPRASEKFETLLERFPRLAAALGDAPSTSSIRGAGPFVQRVRAQTQDRLVLLGDAAGYVDAITGEGLSLAFQSAEALAAVMPSALAAGATRASLAPYQRAFNHHFGLYAASARAVLALARRTALRRRAVRLLSAHPALFRGLLSLAVQ